MVLSPRILAVLNIVFAFFLLIAQVVSVVYLPFDSVEMMLKLFVASFCVMFIMNELETSKILRDSPLLWNWVPRGVSIKISNMKVVLRLLFQFFLCFIHVFSGRKKVNPYLIFRHFSHVFDFLNLQYFYAFVGVVSVEENNLKPKNASEFSFATLTSSYSSAMFIEVTSWMMFVLGVMYISFGLLFGQRYHNKLREDYNNRITERRRMLGESGLRSNSFNVPIQHYGDSKQGVMS